MKGTPHESFRPGLYGQPSRLPKRQSNTRLPTASRRRSSRISPSKKDCFLALSLPFIGPSIRGSKKVNMAGQTSDRPMAAAREFEWATSGAAPSMPWHFGRSARKRTNPECLSAQQRRAGFLAQSAHSTRRTPQVVDGIHELGHTTEGAYIAKSDIDHLMSVA
jgi:hypothetical protein